MAKTKTIEYVFKITATEYAYRRIRRFMETIESTLINSYKLLGIEYYKKYLHKDKNIRMI